MNLTRRKLVASAATVLLPTGPLRAQAWPSRPIRIVVPVAAGTATDLTARIFGEKLAARWGQPVVVESRPGADGLVALGSFVSGRDDHTLLFSFSTAVSLNPLIHAKLPYDPLTDLVPLTTTSEVLFAIAAHGGVAASSMVELPALAQKEPDRLNWAAAPGLPRFVLERHFREKNLKLAYVNYTQTNSAITDLGEGRLQVMIASISTLSPVIESGKVKVLVVASTDRSAMLPNVPSASEAGLPNLAVPAVGCVYGWRDMAPALRDRLAADIDAVAQDADLVTRLGKIGQIVRRSTPSDLARLLADQRQSLVPLAEVMTAKH